MLLQIGPNQGQQWPQKRSTSLPWNGTTGPACLSKPVLEVSSKEFHCLPRQSQYLFHLLSSLRLGTISPLLFLLPTMDLGNTLVFWSILVVVVFFPPTTAFYSVQRSISSLLFFTLNNAVQYTFSRPLILVTALFWALCSWSAFSLKCCAPNQRQ